jgi:hypothetical protein
MAALRLYDLRAFTELPRGAAYGLLFLSFTDRWLVPSIAVVVGHSFLLGESRSTNCAETKV